MDDRLLENVGRRRGLVRVLLVAALRREVEIDALTFPGAKPGNQLIPRHVSLVSDPRDLTPCPGWPLSVIFPVDVGGDGFLVDHFPRRFGLRLSVAWIVHVNGSTL